MEVSVMMAPKTSKSQVGADVCCGWGNFHICEIQHGYHKAYHKSGETLMKFTMQKKNQAKNEFSYNV
jgi:hypothetical protein